MENNTGVGDFKSVRLSLASPDKILDWSRGEVTKPETINYRTQRYEKDGLFCEKIFGPAKDWECYCGKYKRIRYKGIICDKCGVEITRSNVRRERMGHIKLAVPVSHIWFLRSVPSRVGLALGLSYQDLERVVYFSAYIVTSIDEKKRNDFIAQTNKEYKAKVKKVEKETSNSKEAKALIDEIKGQYDYIISEVKGLKMFKVLSEVDYFNLSSQAGQVFTAGIGAEAVKTLLKELDISKTVNALKKEFKESKRAVDTKILRRIKLLQGFKNSGLELNWMFPTVIPIIPPDLRPMVALNGGRYATSDLNDLYRRIINRNNRLKKLISLGAPEVITRNEKRMLQEAVDSLFDNSMRRSHASIAASTGQKRPLRSLADSLKGKQGRFRQNLLGKRVDYSGRSVIVVGPQLKLHQVGLPKKMALELFKPFIINNLIKKEYAHNVRMAGRMVDMETEEAYEILDNIIKKHFVLLNRAPTLHRLSIQAFQPVLIEGKAIQVHPMVCAAFNADFDGDQMAVHVPLTDKAREESVNMMLSSKNLLKPASGEPITIPTLDIVLGIYHLTHIKPTKKNKKLKAFSSVEEALLAYSSSNITVNSRIKVDIDGKLLETSVGRIMFNDLIPEELSFINEEMTKVELKKIVSQLLATVGQEKTSIFVDDIKNLGFKSASKSGISWGMDDLVVPEKKGDIIVKSEEKISKVVDQYNAGLLTNEEKRSKSIEIWNEAKNQITDEVKNSLDKEGSVYAMVHSKARGSESVVVQMTGMKGLMADASGETIELPVKSSYKEGLNVLEFFMSTHGARKGMADTALRTATAGYLTRRLVDVSQDIVVREEDCGDTVGTYLYKEDSDRIGQSFADRVVGRVVLDDIINPKTKEKIVAKGKLVTIEESQAIEKARIEKVRIRSVVACKIKTGICRKCYGLDLGRGGLVKKGEAVGIVAAQAIGEPGTQLTMRTFHVGGVAGSDITQGLPRVEEIFEVRPPKGEALIAEEEGRIKSVETDARGKFVTVNIESSTTKDIKEYQIPASINLKVAKGDLVVAGSVLSEGHIDLRKLYEVMGEEEVHRYIVREIQEIYASQGEGINDKHIEVIIRQMLSRISVSEQGDSNLLVGEVIAKDKFDTINEKLKAKGKEEAKGSSAILGITKVALSTESFLSAASFIETARVLINAAVESKEDHLKGLKENVIIGRLIPAGSGFRNK